MIVNLSNHPFSHWSPKQKDRAISQFGEVIDMSFPDILPEADEKWISELAGNFLEEIIRINPDAVHVQGEQTFTYAIVKLLQKKGIPCYASTTKRNVKSTGNGKTLRQFDFVQFRQFPD